MPAHPSAPLILVVDDEECITFMVSSKIAAMGARTRTFANGEDAFAAAKAERPALIVTDYEMPRMNGLQLAKALHENASTQEMPVILLTARGHRVSPTELARTGVVHLLSKPFSSRELCEIIREHVAELRQNPNQANAA